MKSDPVALQNPAVARYANRASLWPAEARMLDQLRYRGRVIETEAQAHIILQGIRACCGALDGPPRYTAKPDRTNG